jgi:hypothetical protein
VCTNDCVLLHHHIYIRLPTSENFFHLLTFIGCATRFRVFKGKVQQPCCMKSRIWMSPGQVRAQSSKVQCSCCFLFSTLCIYRVHPCTNHFSPWWGTPESTRKNKDQGHNFTTAVMSTSWCITFQTFGRHCAKKSSYLKFLFFKNLEYKKQPTLVPELQSCCFVDNNWKKKKL